MMLQEKNLVVPPESEKSLSTDEVCNPKYARKAKILKQVDELARSTTFASRMARYFHQLDRKNMRFLVPEGCRILDLGCGNGDLLAAMNPASGVGVDFSPEVVRVARESHPGLTFHEFDIEGPELSTLVNDGPFDVIILSDTIGYLNEGQGTIETLHQLCHKDTLLIASYYAHRWEPILCIAEYLGYKAPQGALNHIAPADIAHFFELADFDVVKQERRILIPMRLFGIGNFVNRWLSFLPLVRRLNIRNYTVGRSQRHRSAQALSVSVVIPCRNEKDNIEAAVERLPEFGRDLEVVFVEGHSNDGTYAEIERVAQKYAGRRKIVYGRQDGVGKGDAMRKGFSLATGDVLMILDGDLTVRPEDMPKFYNALMSGKGDLINGSRLVYPMDDDAMRFLNHIANSLFAWIFSWLLNQRITDTLCGTKVLTRAHYDQIAKGRSYFGNFDPFGDFDLIFGASKLNLRITDLPADSMEKPKFQDFGMAGCWSEWCFLVSRNSQRYNADRLDSGFIPEDFASKESLGTCL